MKNKKPVFFIILAVALVMVFTAYFGISFTLGDTDIKIAGAPDMRYGIDIRGGVDAVFEPEDPGRKPTAEELEAARTVIDTRLDQKNILDREVTVDRDNGFVIVRFPWKSDEKDFDPESALAELGETAMLTFRDTEGTVLLDGSHVKKSTPEFIQSQVDYVVTLEFDEEGAKLFADATERLVGKPIEIYLGDMLVQSATVQEHIEGGSAQISHMGSMETAKKIADKINAGALPFAMVTRNHSIISATLGAGALDLMLLAGLIAFCIICAALIAYYRLAGVVACIALVIQISGQILALSVPQITLTLTGIAGVILSIGMGVDANIIISERISDEIKAGRSVRAAIQAGFHNAFSSVFDGNITVLIVAVILMIFGSGSLLSFAYSLMTGIAFNFIAGVTASRLMIRSLSSYRVFSDPVLYRCPSRRITL